ncbi:helix-turn-helix domain-containing protein [Gordonia sp. CPCC 205515]|uniref:IclR family transcriptional regulator n=1 Tax=Gordonia sp. CPCC 205515 TaxID=3140791 RepID=UPI003AF3F969
MTQTVGDSADGRQPAARPASPPTARVISIIELLGRSSTTNRPDAPNLAEIVRSTGLSRATAHAIMGELVDHGWAIRDPADGTFSIGPAFVTLARTTVDADHLTRWARPAIHDLAARIGAPVFVARRTTPDTVTITDRTGPDDDTAWFTIGQTLRLRPPICREFITGASAADRAAWIASAPASVRTRLDLVLTAVANRGYSVERMTDEHLTMLDALPALSSASDQLRSRVGDLLAELTRIDYLPDELTGDVAAVTVGAPVVNPGGQVVASIVACPNATMPADDLRALGTATRMAADAVSRALTPARQSN